MLHLINLLLVSAVLLAACNQTTPTTLPIQPTASIPLPTTVQPTLTPTPIQGTVSIWHSLEEAQVPALEQIITDFQVSYPGIQFDVLYMPLENMQKRYDEAMREGYGPDILFGPASWGPPLFDSGLVMDLSNLAGKDFLTTFNQAALESGRYKEALVGLPFVIRGVTLYRNKTIIPQPASTFDQLVLLAKSATQGEKNGAFLDRGFYFAGGHLLGIDGVLMSPDGMPAFNNEKGIAWLELLKSFEQAGPTDFLSEDDLEAFKEGKVGFIIDGTWNLEAIGAAVGAENLAIDPWPSYRDGYLSGFVQSDNVYLSKSAAQESHAASWKFVEYFLSPEAQTHLTEVGLIPAVSGVRVADPVRNVLISQAIAALAGGVPYPIVAAVEAYIGPMDLALRSFFDGRISAPEALKISAETIQAALAGMNVTPTP